MGNAHDSAETKNIIQQKKKKKDVHSALGYKLIFFLEHIFRSLNGKNAEFFLKQIDYQELLKLC